MTTVDSTSDDRTVNNLMRHKYRVLTENSVCNEVGINFSPLRNDADLSQPAQGDGT